MRPDAGRSRLRVSKDARDRVRVLVVGQGPPTAGGIPTFVSAIVNDEELGRRFDLDYLNTTPQKTKRPGSFAASNFLLLGSHAWAIFKRSGRADAVHLNLAPAPLLPLLRALVLTIAGKLRRARVILHAHTGRMHIAASSRAYRLGLRLLARLVDTLVVVSRSAADTVERVGGAAAYLPNGIDVGPISTGPKEDPPVLAFVGTVCERKGVLDLRAALERVKENDHLPLRVQILGDAKQEGPGEYERMIESYRKRGLAEVEFPGAVDRATVLATLERSSIFCLPSHWEGFPLSLLEGMAAGCAVVATDVGDIAEMLDGGAAGIVVPPKDPQRLADALSSLVADADKRKALGAAARARVESVYTQSELLKRLGDLYEGRNAHST